MPSDNLSRSKSSSQIAKNNQLATAIFNGSLESTLQLLLVGAQPFGICAASKDRKPVYTEVERVVHSQITCLNNKIKRAVQQSSNTSASVSVRYGVTIKARQTISKYTLQLTEIEMAWRLCTLGRKRLMNLQLDSLCNPSRYFEQFVAAIKSRDNAKLISIVESGINLLQQDDHGKTLLHYALQAQNIFAAGLVFKTLETDEQLEHCLSLKDNDNLSPFMLIQRDATFNDLFTRSHRSLFSRVAQLNAQSTSIHSQEVKEMLVSAYQGTYRKRLKNAVRFADEHGLREILPKLGEPHLNYKQECGNEHGFTALMIAAKLGHVNIAKLLISSPLVNQLIVNSDGDTAAMIAVKNGHIDCAFALLETENTNLINTVNNFGENIAQIASRLAVSTKDETLRHGLERIVFKAIDRGVKIKNATYIENSTLLTDLTPEIKRFLAERAARSQKLLVLLNEYRNHLETSLCPSHALIDGDLGRRKLDTIVKKITFIKANPYQNHETLLQELRDAGIHERRGFLSSTTVRQVASLVTSYLLPKTGKLAMLHPGVVHGQQLLIDLENILSKHSSQAFASSSRRLLRK